MLCLSLQLNANNLLVIWYPQFVFQDLRTVPSFTYKVNHIKAHSACLTCFNSNIKCFHLNFLARVIIPVGWAFDVIRQYA